ncbi:hypothetical protein [Arthrobacter sp. YAF16]|uniref:hypothetical protein n=1 Tax=Arthrobacter sp. YAF16 TaxID=3233076 RepID=UPI003F8F77D7
MFPGNAHPAEPEIQPATQPQAFRLGQAFRVQPGQQERLGNDCVAEVVEVERLVGAVRPRIGILNAGDQDLDVRVQLGQVGDERD